MQNNKRCDLSWTGVRINTVLVWLNRALESSASKIIIFKMQFVGGYPNEYCLFIKNLTQQEKKQITNLDEEIKKLKKAQ